MTQFKITATSPAAHHFGMPIKDLEISSHLLEKTFRTRVTSSLYN